MCDLKELGHVYSWRCFGWWFEKRVSFHHLNMVLFTWKTRQAGMGKENRKMVKHVMSPQLQLGLVFLSMLSIPRSTSFLYFSVKLHTQRQQGSNFTSSIKAAPLCWHIGPHCCCVYYLWSLPDERDVEIHSDRRKDELSAWTDQQGCNDVNNRVIWTDDDDQNLMPSIHILMLFLTWITDISVKKNKLLLCCNVTMSVKLKM